VGEHSKSFGGLATCCASCIPSIGRRALQSADKSADITGCVFAGARNRKGCAWAVSKHILVPTGNSSQEDAWELIISDARALHSVDSRITVLYPAA
jgi:hypothetical protein